DVKQLAHVTEAPFSPALRRAPATAGSTVGGSRQRPPPTATRSFSPVSAGHLTRQDEDHGEHEERQRLDEGQRKDQRRLDIAGLLRLARNRIEGRAGRAPLRRGTPDGGQRQAEDADGSEQADRCNRHNYPLPSSLPTGACCC